MKHQCYHESVRPLVCAVEKPEKSEVKTAAEGDGDGEKSGGGSKDVNTGSEGFPALSSSDGLEPPHAEHEGGEGEVRVAEEGAGADAVATAEAVPPVPEGREE